MRILTTVFILSLVGGTILGWMIRPGVTIYLHDIVLIVLLISKYHFRKVNAAGLKLLYPIVTFVFVGIASLLLSVSHFGLLAIGLSSLYLVRWFLYAEIYMLVATTRYVRLWISMLYGVGVIFACSGLVQYFLYPDLRNLGYLGWDPHYYRLFSTLLDPNFAGIVLVLGFLLGLYFWKQTRLKAALVLGQTLLFVGILLTYSRSSYIGFLLGIIVYSFLTRQKHLALGILMLFFAAIAILPLRDMTILRLDRAETAIARIGNWQQGIQIFSERPIFGWGFNALRFVQGGDATSRAAAGVDNSFLFVLATTGLVGFATYLWLIALIVKLGKNTSLGHVLIASIAGVSAHSLFINSLFYPWVMIWLWILAGASEREVSDDS